MRTLRFVLLFAGIIWLLLQSQITTGPEVGVNAPDINATTMTGQKVHSAELLGQTVVIEFWATWCSACVASLPAISHYQSALTPADNVRVFSVHVPKGAFAPSVSNFMEKRGFNFPVILDRDAVLSRDFQIESIPTLVIIAPDGRVRHVKNGALSGDAANGADQIRSWVNKARDSRS